MHAADIGLGSILVPVGGVLLAHFFLLGEPVEVASLYDVRGPYGRTGGFAVPALVAWGLGAAAYFVAGPVGGTLPSLVTAVTTYSMLRKLGSHGR